MAGTERRRRRPAVSCTLCRRRKIKCDRESPCSNCIRSRNTPCVYGNDSQPHSPRSNVMIVPRPTGTTTNDPVFSGAQRTGIYSHSPNEMISYLTPESTNTSKVSTAEVSAMKAKITELEDKLSKVAHTTAQSPASHPPVSSIETVSSHIGGIFHVHRTNDSQGLDQAIIRSVTHKSRILGQRHWMIGIMMIRDVITLVDPILKDKCSKAVVGVGRCKALARVIKEQRAPSWSTLITAALPAKEISDGLVDCYLRTMETVYRILHVPSFRRHYEALWTSDREPDKLFMIQLKLVLAIGATSYDEKFSLRASAVQWVYEAHTWISNPDFKSKLSIRSLQIHLLLLIARECTAISDDLIWISAGTLIRAAVHMGLHRDPEDQPERSTYTIEMRRRLWNTIIELDLQSSLASGAPPFISLDDFDTGPPRNFDDDQILTNGSVPRSDDTFTQSSISIALHDAFPLRLKIAKYLNDINSSVSYEQTLQLDTDLKTAYKSLLEKIQTYISISGASPSTFDIRMLDFLMNRSFLALHIPFLGPALRDIAYIYSRKRVVEMSLKIWCAAYPHSSVARFPRQVENLQSPDLDDLARLVTCGSGSYRTVAMQAVVVAAIELRAHLLEDDAIGPRPLRSDLLSVLDEAKDWSLQSIEAGELNMKGYLLLSMVSGQIEDLMRGHRKEDTGQAIVNAAESAVETCLPIFEREALKHQSASPTTDEEMPLNPVPEAVENWDLMMADMQFDLQNTDTMNWILDDDTPYGLSFFD